MLRNRFPFYLFAISLLCQQSSTALAQQNSSQKLMDLDRIVAVVNSDVITQTTLEREVRTIKQRLQQQGTVAPPTEILERQVLERLVLQRLQLQLANDTGIRVDDDSLNRAIRNIASQNGLSIAEFRDALAEEGFDFADFREDIREEIAITRLQQRQVDNRVVITNREIADLLAAQRTQKNAEDEYHLAHILIAMPEAASPEQIQAAKKKAEQALLKIEAGDDFHQLAIAFSDGQQALEGGDIGWRKVGQLPSLFTEAILGRDTGHVSGLIRSPSGYHILKVLGYRGEAPHIITQTRARHILLRPNEILSAAQIQQTLDLLRQRVLEGEDFAELARNQSQDKATSSEGGSLGWVSPGDLVPEFEKTMSALEPGQISTPFKTGFGWHIVQVLERRELDDTEKFQRSTARELIRQRKIEAETQTWLQRLREEAYVELRL